MIDTVRSNCRSATRRLLLATVFVPALAYATPVFAEDAAPQASDSAAATGDIVVTGTRRGNMSVKDTALAITAVSGETLDRVHVVSLSDLRLIDPSVNIQSFGVSQTKIVLRGIDSTVAATTSLYLDESAVLGGIGGNILGDGKPGIRLHDVDHVEVLKGPQGTLFGTSSMSGTVRVITRKPDLENFQGSFDISGAAVKGGNPFYDGSLTINGPLVKDKLGLRVTGWLENGGGYIDQKRNATTNLIVNGNDQFVRGVRAELLFQATPDFSLLGSVTHQDSKVDGTQAFQKATGPYLNTSPTVELYSDHYNLYALTGNYNLGFGSLIATGNYSDQSVLQAKDSTPTNNGFGVNALLSFVPRIWFKDYNGELRFASKFNGPLQIVAGGYYEHSNNLSQTNAIQAQVGTGLPQCFDYAECRPYALPGRGNSIYETGTDNRRIIDQYAGYGQIDYNILSTVTATAGIRYFAADIHDTAINLQTINPDWVRGIVDTPSLLSDNKGSNHKPSFNFALLWKATPDISLYARAASGFRIGGTNNATQIAIAAGVNFPTTYGPDSLWDYEIGAKGYLFDRKVFFELTGYHIDWSNEQLTAQAGTFEYTINAGKTRSNGVEFNTTIKPVSGLSLTSNATYVDAKLAADLPADVISAGTFGYKGNRIPLTPRWTAAIGGEYEVPLTGPLSGFVQGNLIYHGDSYSTFNNAQSVSTPTTYFTHLPSYTLINAKIGVRSHDGWEFSAFADNIGNKAPWLGVVPSKDGTRIFTARPRTVGMRARMEF